MGEVSLVSAGVVTDRPSSARLYDFLLGGRHNFAADRELGRRLLRVRPEARYAAAENRAFLGRAVRHLATAGVRQFLDLGSGIPERENVHQIAQRADPAARVVYVDNDAGVVAHFRHLLGGNPLASVIGADLQDPPAVLAHPEVRRLLDFSRPVGVLMVAVLHLVPDWQDPAGIVRAYAGSLVTGSYLALSHATADVAPREAARASELYNQNAVPEAHLRSRTVIGSFFDGFDLVEPGLVFPPLWRKDRQPSGHPELAWAYAGVGRRHSGRPSSG
jgi:hypothetical protein